MVHMYTPHAFTIFSFWFVQFYMIESLIWGAYPNPILELSHNFNFIVLKHGVKECAKGLKIFCKTLSQNIYLDNVWQAFKGTSHKLCLNSNMVLCLVLLWTLWNHEDYGLEMDNYQISNLFSSCYHGFLFILTMQP